MIGDKHWEVMMLPGRDYNGPLDQEYDSDDSSDTIAGVRGCPCDECDRNIDCEVCVAGEWR